MISTIHYVRRLRPAIGLCLFALGVSVASQAATVTLTSDDAVGSSSFNSAGGWSNGLAPTSGNDYFNDAHTLRTPPVADGIFAFGGDSLTISGVGDQSGPTTDALMFKGGGASGQITVNNLAFDGGELRNASGDGDYFNLDGNSLTIGGLGMVVHAQGPIYIGSPVAGSGDIKIIANGSPSAARTLHFTSGANTFHGNINLVDPTQSRFALDAGANLNFVIGAADVNNSVSGAGVATFNGMFVLDLSGASTNVGSSWVIANAAAQSFGSAFSVDGFTRVDGGIGPGTWEVATNGTFYSFSTASGTLQVVDTLTTNAVTYSRVAWLRDSVVATDACLMPNGATYGRAINGVSFQKDSILVAFEGYQYTAWYDTVDTTQLIWLARRTVDAAGVGTWEKVQTPFEFTNGDETSWDAHNVIAFGICPTDGTLHLAWDHHNDTLRYSRSVLGLCTTNKAAWGMGMMGTETNKLSAADPVNYDGDVTYPQFSTAPDGTLYLNRRYGISGNGDDLFQSYDPATGTWTPNTLFIARTGNYKGSTSRNAYLNGFDFGPDGTLHVTWTWREGAGSANHDICYAYSTDHGVTWQNNDGAVIVDTGLGESINLDSPGIVIQALDTHQLLINQQAQCVDEDGWLHVLALHRRQDPGYEYPNYTAANFSTLATAYYHYFRNPLTGVWSQERLPVDPYAVGSRPKIGFDASGNVYAAYVSYPPGTAVTPGYVNGQLVIASATRASQYTDWEVVQVMDGQFDGEPLIDQARLLSDNVLSVYIQEHSDVSAAVGTPLHVFDFAVGVTHPNAASFSASLNFAGEDVLVLVPAEPGFEYQLRMATTLSPLDWIDVGSGVTGVKGLLALQDPSGGTAEQRFYTVRRD